MKDSHDKRREAEVHEEMKRLAEIAWAALIGNTKWCNTSPKSIVDQAWDEAEAMYEESQARRPQE